MTEFYSSKIILILCTHFFAFQLVNYVGPLGLFHLLRCHNFVTCHKIVTSEFYFRRPYKNQCNSESTGWIFMRFKHKVDKTHGHLLSFMDHVEIPNGLDARLKKPGVFR